MFSIRRLITSFTGLGLALGMSNSLGTTDVFTSAFGLPDFDLYRIPGVPRIIEVDPAQKAAQAERMADVWADNEAIDDLIDGVKDVFSSNQEAIGATEIAVDAVEAGGGQKAVDDLTVALTDLLITQAAAVQQAEVATGGSVDVVNVNDLDLDPSVTAPSYVQIALGLPVKGRAPKTGYSRDAFGAAWTDDVTVPLGHNGCDTRNDILTRDLVSIVFKSGGSCAVQSGVLADPFTGKSISFERGQKTSSAVQIDHLVPLSDAWQKGAQSWSQAKRTNFANDPINLLAVDGPSNGAKSDSDVATWLPPNKSFRCEYVTMIVNVKAVYGLWVTQAEQDAMVGILEDC